MKWNVWQHGSLLKFAQVVSQPLPGSEAEDGGDSPSNGAEAAMLKDRAPSGQLRSRCSRILHWSPAWFAGRFPVCVVLAEASVDGHRLQECSSMPL